MNTATPISILLGGGIGVLPTDTLYGIVGSARIPRTVERIYTLKRRNPEKPLIVLVASIDDLEEFGVVLSDELRGRLAAYWSPGREPTSIVLPTIDEQFAYLDRGTGTIAFRMPQKETLLDILRRTGPLVAPSANMEGEPPAETIAEARRYFGTDVDFYVDQGELKGKASTLIVLGEDGTRALRGELPQ